MELTYSPARPEDGPVIFGFAKKLIERYETDPALDLEMALGWTKRKIEKRIDEYTRVLCDGAAAAYYRFAPDGERMELDDLYVLPEYRGRGIGRTLVTLLRNEALRRGAIPYYGTSLSNLGSWKTALHSGFVPAWVEAETRKVEDGEFAK